MHSFLTPWSTLSLFLDQWGESGLSSVSHCPNPEERGAGVPGVRAGSLGLGRVPGVWAGSDLDTCAPRSRWPSQAPVAVSSCSKSRGGGRQQAVQHTWAPWPSHFTSVSQALPRGLHRHLLPLVWARPAERPQAA